MLKLKIYFEIFFIVKIISIKETVCSYILKGSLKKMINFDEVIGENIKEHNPNWSIKNINNWQLCGSGKMNCVT